MGRGPATTRNPIMKRHSMLAATTLAGALAIAMPALAGGPLGIISGGAGGGATGLVGGTLSGPGSTLGFGGGGVLGGTGQFQGQIMRPDLTIERPPLRRATGAVQSVRDKAQSQAGAVGDTAAGSNLGLGAGGALDATGQAQGEIVRPDLSIERPQVRRVTGAVQSVGERAQSQAGVVGGAVNSASASAAGEAKGTASSTAGIAQGAGRASTSTSANGNASTSARGAASAGSTSASAEGSAQTRAQVAY